MNRRADPFQSILEAASAFKNTINALKSRHTRPDLHWYPYQSLQVFSVLNTTLREERRNLLELAGSSPLIDVGCGDGDLSFFFESLGYRVLAIDNASPNYNGTRGFQTLHQALQSQVEFVAHDLDRGLEPLRGQTFGLALCLGVLYHLKNPFAFLEDLALHTRHCLLSTRIAAVTPRGVSIEHEPVAYLLDTLEANQDASNFWIFSMTGLRRILERTGWEICDLSLTGTRSRSSPSHPDRDQRAFLLLRSRLPQPWSSTDLRSGWHPLENASWRWTERVFLVSTTLDVSLSQPVLRFQFLLPAEIFRSLGSVELRAKVGDEELPPTVYAHPGPQTYEQRLKSNLDAARNITICFELNNALAPSQMDSRELGVQVAFFDYSSPVSRQLNPITLTAT